MGGYKILDTLRQCVETQFEPRCNLDHPILRHLDYKGVVAWLRWLEVRTHEYHFVSLFVVALLNHPSRLWHVPKTTGVIRTRCGHFITVLAAIHDNKANLHIIWESCSRCKFCTLHASPFRILCLTYPRSRHHMVKRHPWAGHHSLGHSNGRHDSALSGAPLWSSFHSWWTSYNKVQPFIDNFHRILIPDDGTIGVFHELFPTIRVFDAMMEKVQVFSTIPRRFAVFSFPKTMDQSRIPK